ncbi:MAG: hypothetical protein ACYTGN_09765 [Planctomycetota bacterium]
MRRAALALLLPLAACGTVQRLNFSIDPRQKATVVVTGQRANVVIRNTGPGHVTVTWPDGSKSKVGTSGTMRYVSGTARIRLETDDGSAYMRIEAHGGTGISVTTQPTAR